MKVYDPSGQAWRVGRRWLPWRRRLAGWQVVWLDLMSGGPAILLALLAIPVAVIALLELVLALLLTPFAALGRVVGDGGWSVQVKRGSRPWWEDDGEHERLDYDAAGARVVVVADDIRRGITPPQIHGRRENLRDDLGL